MVTCAEPSARQKNLTARDAHAVGLSRSNCEEGGDECDDLELHDDREKWSAEDLLRSALVEDSEVQSCSWYVFYTVEIDKNKALRRSP
jgi:hypothetical protein